MGKKKKQLTINEMISDILNNIDDKTRKILYNAKPDEYGDYANEFHFTLGVQIRNKYNLWSYGNADDISSTIINKLIKKIKEE